MMFHFAFVVAFVFAPVSDVCFILKQLFSMLLFCVVYLVDGMCTSAIGRESDRARRGGGGPGGAEVSAR
jgi:hypothetical protein